MLVAQISQSDGCYNIFILCNRIMNLQQGKCHELYQKYRIEAEIGRGASGVCYRVISNRTKEQYALKKIHINSIKKQNTKEACTQVSILSKLDHPNIIKLLQFFTDENYLYIIMQYAPKGDLYSSLKKRKIRREMYSQAQIWQMSRQLLSAIDYLHTHHIIHRDVKTLNIFLDNHGKLYLGDLGVSKILKTDNGLYSRVGTPLYLAPEIIKYEKYDYKADIWGLGCVCYQLAALNHPFEGKNIISLGQNIIASQPKQIDNYSPELNNFLMDMLEKNPIKRLGAGELLKKYFKEGVRPSVKFQPISAQSFERQSNPPKIIEEKSSHLLKSNMIRRKALNNYLQQKLLFNQSDKIKDETHKEHKHIFSKYGPTKKYIEDKNQEDTLIFTKKIVSNEENKKFVEATYKSCMAVHPVVSSSVIKSQAQPAQIRHKNGVKTEQQLFYFSSQKESEAINIKTEKQFGFNKYVSEKKITPAMVNNKSSDRKFQPIFSETVESAQTSNKRVDTSYTDLNRLPSQNYSSGLNKISSKVRPKSSIMTKQRHESTMKNIKKSFKREQLQSMDRFVQTQVLKRPQVIIL